MFSSNASQVSSSANYIEDFFSAWLRTGTGSSQTVTTGIEEDTGALVISKSRSAATDWAWYDTFRGATKDLVSNSTAAQTTQSQGLTSFNSNGHTWGTLAKVNTSGATYVDFVLKPQPKFFDVVTYTGTGFTEPNISHNLGSVPGCIIIKRTNSTGDWFVYHRSIGTSGMLVLNSTAASASNNMIGAAPTSTTFKPAGDADISGATYVAYLFAHNAGGFGLSGEDNVISCGSFTTDGSGAATVNLGYEPQYFLFKRTDSTSNWRVLDVMRGGSLTQSSPLIPNTADVENSFGSFWSPTATGFNIINQAASSTWIYIAIRRGPMKVPESGTSVFAPVAYTGNGSTQIATTGFPVDTMIEFERTNSSGVPAAGGKYMTDRLRGSSAYLETSSAGAEGTGFVFGLANNTGVNLSSYFNSSSRTYIIEAFRRAPGFFDEVCYTGTGVARTVAHNLGVAPELMIVKSRDTLRNWDVYHSSLGATKWVPLNLTNAAITNIQPWNNTEPTASVFTVGVAGDVNASAVNYVAYLFASCPGVSKCGSFTGNGSSQTINCGFTGGARFVLIKAASTTGDWLVADSARGIVSGNDPYLELNTTNAEVTGEDWLDTDSSGFVVNEVSGSNANTNGVTYIYLAIA